MGKQVWLCQTQIDAVPVALVVFAEAHNHLAKVFVKIKKQFYFYLFCSGNYVFAVIIFLRCCRPTLPPSTARRQCRSPWHSRWTEAEEPSC